MDPEQEDRRWIVAATDGDVDVHELAGSQPRGVRADRGNASDGAGADHEWSGVGVLADAVVDVTHVRYDIRDEDADYRAARARLRSGNRLDCGRLVGRSQNEGMVGLR